MRGLTQRTLSLAAACAMTTALFSAPALALEQIKMSIFQSNFCCFAVYVAKHLKLFEKHSVDVELVYGTGIQPANIFVSGSAESGAFAVEHGVTVSSKGQDLKLLVLQQQLPPLSLIVHNDVPTPNADKPYPQNLIDLKGLKIGISGRGASTDTATRFMLKQAGLDPDKDVTIMPVGDPGTMLASLKNKVIDAAMAVEPTQTAAVQSLKFAKTMVDIEGGGGPNVFHPYAYNGIFVHSAFLKDHPDTARAIVAAIVEACAVVNDPPHERPDGRRRQFYEGLRPRRRQSLSDEIPFELRRDRDTPGCRQRQRHAGRRQDHREGGALRATRRHRIHAVRGRRADALIRKRIMADSEAVQADIPLPSAAADDNLRQRVLLARFAVIGTFLAVWQGAVSFGLIDSFWVSSPVLVSKELWQEVVSGDLIRNVSITVFEALIAFFISSALGIAAGLMLARSPFWDEVLAPLVLALNSLPRVALAPLIILWFGIGIVAKVVTAFTLVFFILLVNTLGGAKNVDTDILTIAQLMGASRRDILWKVTLPSALPWIFAGLNIGLTYALLGVIVAEILASNQGIGYVISSGAANFNTAAVFAGLVTLAVVAWLFSAIMRKVEARLLRWKPAVNSA